MVTSSDWLDNVLIEKVKICFVLRFFSFWCLSDWLGLLSRVFSLFLTFFLIFEGLEVCGEGIETGFKNFDFVIFVANDCLLSVDFLTKFTNISEKLRP